MKTLIEYFKDIAAIPHPSGQEGGIADYLENFAREKGLECHRDALHNVMIKKPATPGFEGVPAVVLQGHTDMVPAAEEGKDFDFSAQPIELVFEGDTLCANGTTLGGDNAVAVVIMLRLLADASAKHPALECLFTSQEEVGLVGAAGVDPAWIQGKYMINMDAGPEGAFLVSCSGGLGAHTSGPLSSEAVRGAVWQLKIAGLKSGHSGEDIVRERAGALKLMAIALDTLRRKGGARLISLKSGDKDNVIPFSAIALFAMDGDPKNIVESFMREEAQPAYSVADPDIFAEIEAAKAESMLTEADSDRMIDLLVMLPHGVEAMSAAMPGLVETSANLARADIGPESYDIHISIRSASEQKKDWFFRRVEIMGKALGVPIQQQGRYPGWAYEKDSPLRDRAMEVYRRLRGKEPEVLGVHGGLECGLFKGKKADLDIIAIGPDAWELHTAKEGFSISSLERTAEFVRELLATMGDM